MNGRMKVKLFLTRTKTKLNGVKLKSLCQCVGWNQEGVAGGGGGG